MEGYGQLLQTVTQYNITQYQNLKLSYRVNSQIAYYSINSLRLTNNCTPSTYQLSSKLPTQYIHLKLSTMSNQHIPPSTLTSYHQRQPIHFYQSSRPSVQYPSSLTYLSSQTQSSPKKPSQSQRNQGSLSSVSIEQFMSVNRVMSRSYKSDKYRELSKRLELLESNLNRLNGQHQGLREMFQRVDEVTRSNGVLFELDQLKDRLRRSQEKLAEQESKLKQRYQTTYTPYTQLFTQLQPHTHPTLPHLPLPPTTHLQPYQTLYLTHSLTLQTIHSNITRHLSDISQQLQHDADMLLEHFGVGQRIREERKMVEDRMDRVRRKLGELRCVVEFEVAEGVKGEREGRGKLKVGGRYDAKDSDKVEESQTSSIVKQLRMVSSQSIDRLAYRLISIDTNFVILIQSHKQQPNPKSPPKKPEPQSQQSPHKSPQKLSPQPPHHLLTQLSQFNQQLQGFKRYFEKTVAKLQGMGQLQGNRVQQGVKEEINAIVQAIRKLEDEARVLGENLEYFRVKCIQ